MSLGDVVAHKVDAGHVGPLPEHHDSENSCYVGRQEVADERCVQEHRGNPRYETIADVHVEPERPTVGERRIELSVGRPDVGPDFGRQRL